MRRIPLSVAGIYLAFAVLAAFIAWAAITDGILTNPWPIAAVLLFLAVCTVSTSVSILRRKRVYHWLSPSRRPRRWVLIILMQLFGFFCLVLLVGFIFRDVWISRALLVFFAIDSFATLLTLKWFPVLVDQLVIRQGWKLR
jgi:hypothetical protein